MASVLLVNVNMDESHIISEFERFFMKYCAINKYYSKIQFFSSISIAIV